jgi:hypothetical protein
MLDEHVLARIESIQQELEFLKKAVTVKPVSRRRKTALRGLWQGIQISEEDIAVAKRAIFKFAYLDDSQ